MSVAHGWWHRVTCDHVPPGLPPIHRVAVEADIHRVTVRHQSPCATWSAPCPSSRCCPWSYPCSWHPGPCVISEHDMDTGAGPGMGLEWLWPYTAPAHTTCFWNSSPDSLISPDMFYTLQTRHRKQVSDKITFFKVFLFSRYVMWQMRFW